MAVRLRRYLIQDATSVPFGMREEVLERLVIAIRDHFLHALHIPATGLYQSLEVLFGLLTDRAGPTLKVREKALNEIVKPKPHPFKWRWGIGRLLGLTSLLAG